MGKKMEPLAVAGKTYHWLTGKAAHGNTKFSGHSRNPDDRGGQVFFLIAPICYLAGAFNGFERAVLILQQRQKLPDFG